MNQTIRFSLVAVAKGVHFAGWNDDIDLDRFKEDNEDLLRESKPHEHKTTKR